MSNSVRTVYRNADFFTYPTGSRRPRQAARSQATIGCRSESQSPLTSRRHHENMSNSPDPESSDPPPMPRTLSELRACQAGGEAMQ